MFGDKSDKSIYKLVYKYKLQYTKSASFVQNFFSSFTLVIFKLSQTCILGGNFYNILIEKYEILWGKILVRYNCLLLISMFSGDWNELKAACVDGSLRKPSHHL